MRTQIPNATSEISQENYGPHDFRSGVDRLPVSGKCLDRADFDLLIKSCSEGWLTAGRFSDQFEKSFADFVDHGHGLFVNSGSSANLLALTALTSPQLKERRLCAGDEVITLAASFPTTVNPIVQNRAIPVFIDVTLGDYQVNCDQLEQALSPKTKAVMMAHTLGNPFDVKTVKDFCEKNKLWLIEDCCDALGAQVNEKHVGAIADFSTFSFYPAHHMTTGEGGMVCTSNLELKKLAQSFRDWGRDCWCPTGRDNTCGKRFEWNIDDEEYDHKYIYSHVGYNLKATDMQAALGLSQLKKVPDFVRRRNENFYCLHHEVQDLEECFIFPRSFEDGRPSWFGYPLTTREEGGRKKIIAFLEKNLISTRPLFAGNLLKHPLYKNVETRSAGSLFNTDKIMRDTFWVGVWPGLTCENMRYMARMIKESVQ